MGVTTVSERRVVQPRRAAAWHRQMGGRDQWDRGILGPMDWILIRGDAMRNFDFRDDGGV